MRRRGRALLSPGAGLRRAGPFLGGASEGAQAQSSRPGPGCCRFRRPPAGRGSFPAPGLCSAPAPAGTLALCPRGRLRLCATLLFCGRGLHGGPSHLHAFAEEAGCSTREARQPRRETGLGPGWARRSCPVRRPRAAGWTLASLAVSRTCASDVHAV